VTPADQQKIRRTRTGLIAHDPARVVWEYVSPHFADEPGAPGVNNWVFRALRYTVEEIEAARRG